jgi:HK97 family phage portal protein
MLNNLFEKRAISFQTIFGVGDSYAFATKAGVEITQLDSLRIGALYSCVTLLSDTVSTLPLDVYTNDNDERIPFRPRPEWTYRPDAELSLIEHFQQVMVSLLLNGNAFVRIYRDTTGKPVNLVVLNPQRVIIQRNQNSRRIEYVIDNGKFVVPSIDMLHLTELLLPGEIRGKSRVDELKDALGLAAALDEFAQRFFGQGSITSGVIEYPGNLTKEQAVDLVEGYEQHHKGVRKAHRPGILYGGAKFVKTGVDPNEAQMIESRKLAIEDIARIFRVPPHMISVTTPGSMSYASVEANGIQFVTHTLRPYITKIEEAYSRLLPPGVYIKFNVDGLLRGDISTRFAAYSTGNQAGFLSINDIRKLEDMTPVDGGDSYRVPLANVNLAAANIAETERLTVIAQRLIASGFEPMAVMKAFNLPDIPHTGIPTNALQPLAQLSPTDPLGPYQK